MPLWRLFYHVVFATDERRLLLVPPLREAAERLLAHQCDELGCLLHALHVQPEHAHLVLSIPPSQAVGIVIGKLKGNSSHALGQLLPAGRLFAWQTGYGVFSFGERNLPDVVRYVQDQERRHATGALWAELERAVAGGDDGPRRFSSQPEPPA